MVRRLVFLEPPAEADVDKSDRAAAASGVSLGARHNANVRFKCVELRGSPAAVAGKGESRALID
jgi:hypothetical protein